MSAGLKQIHHCDLTTSQEAEYIFLQDFVLDCEYYLCKGTSYLGCVLLQY